MDHRPDHHAQRRQRLRSVSTLAGLHGAQLKPLHGPPLHGPPRRRPGRSVQALVRVIGIALAALPADTKDPARVPNPDVGRATPIRASEGARGARSGFSPYRGRRSVFRSLAVLSRRFEPVLALKAEADCRSRRTPGVVRSASQFEVRRPVSFRGMTVPTAADGGAAGELSRRPGAAQVPAPFTGQKSSISSPSARGSSSRMEQITSSASSGQSFHTDRVTAGATRTAVPL